MRSENEPAPLVRRRRLPAVLLLALLLPACGKTRSPPQNTKTGDSKTAPAKSIPSAKLKKKPVPPTPATADAAVRVLLQGVRNKRPEVLWDFLPAGYQRDIADLVHLFGKKMDPELWGRTMAVGRRTVTLCRNRKAAILGSRPIRNLNSGDLRRLSADWDATVALADTLFRSDFADLKKVRTLDVRKFLSATGGEALKQLARFSRLLPDDALKGELDQFADIEVKLISSRNNVAVVELSLKSTAGVGREISFIRVEGKWIPEGMETNWKATITAIRKDLNSKLRPELLQQNKRTMLAILDVFEKELKSLESATTDDEFRKRFADSALSGAIVTLFRTVTRQQGSGGVPITPKNVGSKTKKNPAEITVTVIVQEILDDETADSIGEKLVKLGNVDVGPQTTVGRTTRFQVFEVKDFAAFRKKITFAEVVSADADKREIVIKLRKSR